MADCTCVRNPLGLSWSEALQQDPDVVVVYSAIGPGWHGGPRRCAGYDCRVHEGCPLHGASLTGPLGGAEVVR